MAPQGQNCRATKKNSAPTNFKKRSQINVNSGSVKRYSKVKGVENCTRYATSAINEKSEKEVIDNNKKKKIEMKYSSYKKKYPLKRSIHQAQKIKRVPLQKYNGCKDFAPTCLLLKKLKITVSQITTVVQNIMF